MLRYAVPQCMTTEWTQILLLPSKSVRDLASVIACPPLLQSSSELPLVPDAVFGTRGAGWERSLSWLKSLDPAEVDAWFDAKQRSRLGYRFADCVEYNLRLSPFFRPPYLQVSQQVFRRTARSPVISLQSSTSEEGAPAEHLGSENEEASGSACDVLSERADYGLWDMLNESEEGASYRSLASNENELDKARISRVSLEEEMRDGLPIGKKKSRRLQRKAAKKMGKTVTVGEFDILFLQERHPSVEGGSLLSTEPHTDQSKHALGQSTGLAWDTNGSAKSDEKVLGVEHWELSVKFLLYIGPPKRLLQELGRPELVVSLERSEGSLPAGGFLAENSLSSDDSVYLQEQERTMEGEEREDRLRDRCGMQNETGSQEEDLLYYFVGPHAGERLSDRKDRIAKQLRLSEDPLAKQVLADLFLKTPESRSLSSEPYSFKEGSRSTSRDDRPPNRAEPVQETELSNSKPAPEVHMHLYGEARDAGPMTLEVTPRAFVKGYLFYEHKLWKVLAGRGQLEARANEQDSSPRSSPSLEASKAPEACSNGFLCSGAEVNSVTGASVETSRAEAAQNAASSSLEFHRQHPACSDATAAFLDPPEESSDACAAVSQKARLNPSHWIGWWTRDLRASLADPIFSKSRWYIIPKMEWLSPIVIEDTAEAWKDKQSAIESSNMAPVKDHSPGHPLLSNKCTSTALSLLEQAAADRQVETDGQDHHSAAAEMVSQTLDDDIDVLSRLGVRSGRQLSSFERASHVLTSAELLSEIETLQAVAKRCNVPRRGRVLVAELQWNSAARTEDENCKQGKETGAKEGAWLELSRGFVVESTWLKTGELPCIMLP